MVESGEFDNADIYITPPDGVQTDEDSADEDQGGLIDNLNGHQLQAEAEAVVRTSHYCRMRLGDDSDKEDADESSDNKLPVPSSKKKRRTSASSKPKSGARKSNKVDLPATAAETFEAASTGAGSRDSDKEDVEESSDDALPVPSSTKKRMTSASSKPKTSARKWSKADLPASAADTFGATSTGEGSRAVDEDWTPTLWFEQFFSEDLIQMMVNESILYAKFRGNHQFIVSSKEIRAFLAVLILSGYVQLPRRRMFWEQAADCHNPVAAGFMTRDRFDEIMRYFHLADNNRLDKDDKFAKLRPLFNSLNQSFLALFRNESYLSIDESMVPYFGHHGCKQFIRGKPIRFGYKMWCLNTTLGYLVQFQAYQGKGSVTHQELGLGGSVVVDLIDSLPEGPKYKLFFDNFFTSLRLLDHLTDHSFGATGTLRANRTDKCPLITPAAMKKKDRGHIDHRYDPTGKVIVIRWHDNSPVTIASNVYGVHPVDKAKRWSSADKKEILVTQPAAIKQYNICMGGTDRMDQNIGSYRTSIRSKKWWWPLFIYMIDVSLQNAFYLYKRSPAYSQHRLDLLGFKREVVEVYSQRYTERLNTQQSNGRTTRHGDWRVSAEIRLDHLDHLPLYVDRQKQCDVCKKKANFVCQKCTSGGALVGLHPKDCFLRYHTE